MKNDDVQGGETEWCVCWCGVVVLSCGVARLLHELRMMCGRGMVMVMGDVRLILLPYDGEATWPDNDCVTI